LEGTRIEFSKGIITGRTKKIWSSQERADKAKELTGNKRSINLGNSPNDLEMLKYGTFSFYLTEDEQKTDGNIVYTDLKHLPMELKKLDVIIKS